MKSNLHNQRNAATISVLLLALLFSFANYGYAWDYGNGRHGSFVLTTNATIEQLYQTVRLPSDPAQYNPSDTNAIPNFQSLVITNGATLTANPWNGSIGGRIVLKVEGTLAIAAGSAISATGIGFQGGGWDNGTQGHQGESYLGGGTDSQSANIGGGGGGVEFLPGGTFASAGGGGYGTTGGNGSVGAGGGTYGDQTINTIYLGSGGGGGFAWISPPYAQTVYGGNGGGAIDLNAGNLQVNGQIQANGGDYRFSVSNGSVLAGAGGGSGGSVVLHTKTANLGANQITANGGNGNGSGGGGGVGRIMVGYFSNYTGTTTPSAYTLLDTNSDNITIITSQPLSQNNFWSSNAVITVGISGYPPFIFQWYFNGTPISGATNQALSLTSLDFTNQGNYSVTISNAVMSVSSSNAFLTVLDGRDFDGDGIPNYWEIQYGLNLNNPNDALTYPPGDKLTYLEKYLYDLNPLTNDTDGDGLTDYDEIFIYHTNPLLADTDGDGIPDGWEVQHGLNPLVNDASLIGLDGVSNLQIYQYDKTNSTQLDPHNPFFAPGTSIYEVLNNGQHTNRYFYDHEDRLVGVESSRGISIAYIYDGNGNLTRQTVLSRAGETNGLPVLWQFLNGLTNGTTASGPYGDPDGDGWSNYQEWKAGSDPNNSQSTPNRINNPGANIASITFPFTPSNCVMAAGQLNSVAGDEIVVGADGNATGKTNSLFILTQGASSWQVQQVPVGAFGLTSIAIGQPTNRPAPAIYVGLRQPGGHGGILELNQNGGTWQTNLIAVSTSEAAFVYGVRQGGDLVAGFSTNGLDGALFSLSIPGTNGVWSAQIISTNISHRGLGTHGLITARPVLNPPQNMKDASIRLLDNGGIEIIGGSLEAVKNGLLLPTNWVVSPLTGKYYFESTNTLSWYDGETFAQQYVTHLATISDLNENTWVASQFLKPFWIGLYLVNGGGSVGNIYGAWTSSGQPPNIYYANFNAFWDTSPYYSFRYAGTNGVCVGLNGNSLWNSVQPFAQFYAVADATGVQPYTNQWLIPEPSATSRFALRGLPLAVGLPRPNQTNSTSIFYAFADDQNLSAQLDAGDDFTLAEYVVSGNTWTTNTLFQVPITSASVAQSFSLAAVNFTGTGKDTLFTGEPDGRIYSWSGADASSPLQRQLFSDAYVGKAWQAMCGVQMPAFGKGLAGLMVDPTNLNVCNVIFWSPQVVLPTPQPSLIETAPYAAVIPSANTLGSNAVVTIRLGDNEGNASTPFLQYQILGSATWQNATLTALDGAFYSLATRVAALPNGVNHTLVWNALGDLGGNIVTNVLLRARAQDFMLMGDWSLPTPFQLNTTITTSSNPTNSPITFTGIMRVQGGMGFNWQGSTNAWLYLQRSPALAGTNAVWVNIWTGAPPTLFFGSYTDFFGTNPMEFYRMKSVSP